MKLTADKMLSDFAAKRAAGKKLSGMDRAFKPSALTAEDGTRYFDAWLCCKVMIGQRTKRTAFPSASRVSWKQAM
jgi:hypothetical protein